MLEGFNRLEFVNDILSSKMYGVGGIGGNSFIINKFKKKKKIKVFLGFFNLRFFEGGLFVCLFGKVLVFFVC